MTDISARHKYKFVPARLRDARVARGYSLAELAMKVGVTSQSISKYELGQTKPSISILVSLANNLNFPIDYFSKAKQEKRQDYSNSAVYFRSMKTTPKKYKEAFRTRIEWIDDIYRYIRKYVDFPKIKFPDLGELIEKDEFDIYDIENIANELRKYWKLGKGPIDNISETFEENGIVIAKIEFGSNKLDAFSQWFNGVPYIILGSDKDSAVRLRFDLAHELGHLILHSNITDEDIKKSKVLDKIEQEANLFAGCLLLPEESFGTEVLSTSIDSFILLKRKWKVSIGAMIMRCKHLKIFNENQINYLFRQRSGRGMNKKEPLDDIIKFEKPYLIKQALELIFNNDVLLPNDFVNDIAYNKEEIESLCWLTHGFLNSKKGKSSLKLKVIK